MTWDLECKLVLQLSVGTYQWPGLPPQLSPRKDCTPSVGGQPAGISQVNPYLSPALLDCGLSEGRMDVWFTFMSSQYLVCLSGSVSGLGMEKSKPNEGTR